MSLPETFGEYCSDQSVGVITSDGKVLVGTLKEGVEKHPLGLCIIRGENVALMGHIDRELDLRLDLASCTAKPLKPVTH